MSSEYLTIAAESKAVFREKMSRFIAFAVPVASESSARDRIAEITNEYHDARHVCWAYMLGAERDRFLSTDNGEPSGTAGKPILGQIRSVGLTNILIVVVRYFGGIKLGTSGLIAAYREAARLAIEAAEIVTGYEESTIAFHFPYISMNNVMRVVKESEATIVGQQFDNSCFIALRIRSDRAEQLTNRLTGIDGVTSAEPENV